MDGHGRKLGKGLATNVATENKTTIYYSLVFLGMFYRYGRSPV